MASMLVSKVIVLGALLSVFALVTTGAEQVVIAIDESGSMRDGQQRIKDNVALLFNELNSPTGLTKPQIGIVGYGAGLKFSQNAYTVTPLTNDTNTFRDGLATLDTNGAFEWGYKLAVELATNKIRGPSLGLDLNPARGFCLLLISDEPFNQDKNFRRADVEAAFAATGGVFFGVGLITHEDTILADNTGGEVVPFETFEADPTSVIDALIAKCKATLPPEESGEDPSNSGILESLLCNPSNIIEGSILGINTGIDMVGVLLEGTSTILDFSTGSVTFSTQNLVNKIVLTISTLLDGVDCLVHHVVETVDDVISRVIITVTVVLDDVIVDLKKTLIYVDGILDKTLLEVECTGTSISFLLHSVYEMVHGVVHKVSETLEGTLDDVEGLLTNLLNHVHDILTLTVNLIEDNVDDLEDSMLEKLSLIGDIIDLAKSVLCGGPKNIVEVVGGTVEWITLDLVDKVVFTANALLDTVTSLLTHTIHKVDGVVSEIEVLVKATLADAVITLKQTILYVDSVLDKVLYEVVYTSSSGQVLLHSRYEEVNNVVTAISEVLDGAADDVKALLGNRLVEVDGLLQLLLSTVNNNLDELTAALITDSEMDNLYLLCASFIEALGLGKLLDGILLGGLDVDLSLCPCFGGEDLISIEACIEIENLNSLDILGVSVCSDNLSLETSVTGSEHLVAYAGVEVNGSFQCVLNGDLNRRNLRHRQLLLGNVIDTVVGTVDDVVDTIGDTVDTVVDVISDTVGVLLSGLTFTEYNSCISLLLQRCREVPQC